MYAHLKTLRESLGMTQAEFGQSIGIAKSTYNNYEKGIREPKSDFWLAIAEKYDVTIDYLMGFSDDPHGYAQAAANESISADERQKKLEGLAETIRKQARLLKTTVDSTYSFYDALGSMVGLSKPVPCDIALKPQQSAQIERDIKSLVEKFLATANSEETADFWARYDKIGREFRERMEHPEKTPYPSLEEMESYSELSENFLIALGETPATDDPPNDPEIPSDSKK